MSAQEKLAYLQLAYKNLGIERTATKEEVHDASVIKSGEAEASGHGDKSKK